MAPYLNLKGIRDFELDINWAGIKTKAGVVGRNSAQFVVDCKFQLPGEEEVNFEWTLGATQAPARDGSYTTFDLAADMGLKVGSPVSPLARAVLENLRRTVKRLNNWPYTTLPEVEGGGLLQAVLTGGQLAMRNVQTFEADDESLVMKYSDKELSTPGHRQYLGAAISDTKLTQQLQDRLNSMGKIDLLEDILKPSAACYPLVKRMNLGEAVELFSELEEEYGAATEFNFVALSEPTQPGNEDGVEAMKTGNWVKFSKDSAEG